LWLRIDTRPAKKILAGGRNAHFILESPDWWRKKVAEFFDGEIVHDDVNRKGKLDIAIIRQ